MHIAELQQMLQQREKNVIAGQNELAQLQQALVEANIKVQQLQMHVEHRAGIVCVSQLIFHVSRVSGMCGINDICDMTHAYVSHTFLTKVMCVRYVN